MIASWPSITGDRLGSLLDLGPGVLHNRLGLTDPAELTRRGQLTTALR